MGKIYQSVEALIGHTPLIELNNIKKKYGFEARILAKLEALNPAGSAKDRVAAAMINDAEKSGKLRPGSVIIEPTSGNTGIGLAFVAAIKGYRIIIVMPDNMSAERQKLMKAYGAEIVLTPGALGMQGAIEKAGELAADIPGSFIPNQFMNPANPQSHFDTTGPEIYGDTDGKLDIFIAGIGSGGTITGTGNYLKSKDPHIEVIGFEPASSPFITKGTAGTHKIQGIGAGFIPPALDLCVCDEILTVTDEDAINAANDFIKTEGFLVGISSGAALSAAISVAKRPECAGKTVVVLLPDSGDRYFSSELFD